MTGDERVEAVSALLSETERAHGAYESTELSGEYDNDWARWYAAYAVEHGLGALVGHDVGVDQVAGFLASTFETFTGAEPRPTEGWAAWTAHQIVAEL